MPEYFIYEDEYFIYSYSVNNFDKDEDKYIYILDLTERGKEQEILIIPGKVNGREVLAQRPKGLVTMDRLILLSENLKKIYLPENVGDVGSLDVPSRTKIFAISVDMNTKTTPMDGYLFVNREVYESEEKTKSLPANVSYKWNYEGAPNLGYYWIDDYYNEIISYIPAAPVREGYIFDGWYKEPECINKWDFDNDIVIGTEWESINVSPYKKLVKYQETVLYAKWVEC